MSAKDSEISKRRSVAFVDTVFPTVGVFIAAEIDYIRRQSVEVTILPLRKSSMSFHQDEYKNLMPLVVSGGILKSLGLLPSAIGLCLRRPLRIVQIVVEILWDLRKDPIYFLKTAAILPKCVLFAALVKGKKIDHMHGNWAHYPATAARFIARLLDLSYSFAAHAGADIYRHPAGLPRKIEDASFINTCTRTNLRYFESLCGKSLRDKVEVIYHGIDLERFRSLPAEPNGSPVFLSVGSYTEAKGFKYAIEACSILRDRRVKFEYVIIGKGKDRPALEEQIRRLGLDGLVTLQDEMSHSGLREKYARATVFLAPSIITAEGGRDGIPNVLVEAMSMGLPVVASNVSGIPELVAHEENGLLAPPADPDALANSLERLLADPQLCSKLAAAAKRKVEAEFDRTSNSAALYKLFNEKVLNGKPGS